MNTITNEEYQAFKNDLRTVMQITGHTPKVNGKPHNSLDMWAFSYTVKMGRAGVNDLLPAVPGFVRLPVEVFEDGDVTDAILTRIAAELAEEVWEAPPVVREPTEEDRLREEIAGLKGLSIQNDAIIAAKDKEISRLQNIIDQAYPKRLHDETKAKLEAAEALVVEKDKALLDSSHFWQAVAFHYGADHAARDAEITSLNIRDTALALTHDGMLSVLAGLRSDILQEKDKNLTLHAKIAGLNIGRLDLEKLREEEADGLNAEIDTLRAKVLAYGEVAAEVVPGERGMGVDLEGVEQAIIGDAERQKRIKSAENAEIDIGGELHARVHNGVVVSVIYKPHE